MVVQVLVLALQNSVEYRQRRRYLRLDPLSPGRGSIGVAGFGAIFANHLAGNLDRRLPAGMHVPAAANPAALHPVFLAAAGAAALAFVLTWFLRELPLRTRFRKNQAHSKATA
jgi:hypothetical protein